MGIRTIHGLFYNILMPANSTRDRCPDAFLKIRDEWERAGFLERGWLSSVGCAVSFVLSLASSRWRRVRGQTHTKLCALIYLGYRWLMQLQLLPEEEVKRAGCDFGLVMSMQEETGKFNVRCPRGDFMYRAFRTVSRPIKVAVVSLLQVMRGTEGFPMMQ